MGAYEIFEKHTNYFKGVMGSDGQLFGEKEKVPGFCGARIELMWAL